jgi:hypothetical protein
MVQAMNTGKTIWFVQILYSLTLLQRRSGHSFLLNRNANYLIALQTT